MKQTTIGYYVKELREAENRLSDLNQIGIKALSSYDINIAHSGDGKLALWTAKRLVNNQIKYFNSIGICISPVPEVPITQG